MIHNLHIHFPAGKFDVRVSVNFETPQNEALILNLKPKLKRFKDRMTYNIQEGIQIDLTKVDKIETVDTGSKRKYNGNSGAEETSFELELELNSDKIQFARDKLDKKEPEEYLNLVKKFVNNLRDIAHKMKKT